jgi:hypothetical protein
MNDANRLTTQLQQSEGGSPSYQEAFKRFVKRESAEGDFDWSTELPPEYEEPADTNEYGEDDIYQAAVAEFGEDLITRDQIPHFRKRALKMVNNHKPRPANKEEYAQVLTQYVLDLIGKSTEDMGEVAEAYQGAKTKGTKQAWGKETSSEKKVAKEKNRKADKAQTKKGEDDYDDEKLKEELGSDPAGEAEANRQYYANRDASTEREGDRVRSNRDEQEALKQNIDMSLLSSEKRERGGSLHKLPFPLMKGTLWGAAIVAAHEELYNYVIQNVKDEDTVMGQDCKDCTSDGSDTAEGYEFLKSLDYAYKTKDTPPINHPSQAQKDEWESDYRNENKIKEALRRTFKKNPALIKVAKKIGVKKLVEEMSKRDFVAQVKQRQAPSRSISDEEAGSVESFNNWLNDENSPEYHQRQQDWEPAQSYRGGRVLAYNRKEQEYYDVQNDMPVSDEEMDAILPESQGISFEPGDQVQVQDDRTNKIYTVVEPMAGGAVVKDEEGNLEKIRDKFLSKIEGDQTIMRDKTLTEGEFVGHHAIIDGEFFVDSNFLNKLKNIPEMGSLDHVGFGDFSFNSQDGKEMRFSRGGQDIPGQVGRSHSVYAHPPEFIEDVVAAMEAAGHSTSESSDEALPPQGEPAMQQESITRRLHKLLEGKKLKKTQVNKLAKMVAAKLLEKKYKRDEDEDEKDKKEDLDESGAACGGGEAIKLKVNRDGDEPGDFPGDGLEPVAEDGGSEGLAISVDLEKDNENDSQAGGPGNWEKIVIPQHILQQAEDEDHAFELAWDYVSEETGWLVAGTDEESEMKIKQAVGGSIQEKTKKDLSDRRPVDTPADRLKAESQHDDDDDDKDDDKDDAKTEGKLPPALQAAIDKKKGKDGDDDKDEDDDKEESKTEGKLPPGLEKFQKGKKGEDGDEDKDEDKDDEKEDLDEKTKKDVADRKPSDTPQDRLKPLEERGYRGESEPGSMFDPYGDDDADQYGGQEEDDELSQYKDLLAALEGGDEGLEPPPPDVQAQLDAEFGEEEEEEEHDPRFDGDSLQEWWNIRNAKRTEKFMSWAIPKKKK